MDASKTFDKVILLTLFQKLFKRSMCPLFLRFFIHSYCNQKMRINWKAAISCSFDTSNGVKEGGVLSPVLFNVYLDELILLLREKSVGCHMNGLFVGAFCYADDIDVWHLPLCKLYKCFDLFLLNHDNMIANRVCIRDLCLLRENSIIIEDQDLTSTMLTYMIDLLIYVQYFVISLLYCSYISFAFCKNLHVF